MERLVKDTDFEKTEIVRRLFNRCTLLELLIIDNMQETGEIKRKAIEYQENDITEQKSNPIEQMHLYKRAFNQRVKIYSID